MHNESPRARVLIVDGEARDLAAARAALEASADVECLADPHEALDHLSRVGADLVVTDQALPGMSGLELLERIRREHPGTDVIVLTASPSVDSAIGALRMGAVDYLRKPLQGEELALSVYRTMARRSLLEENHRLRDSLQMVEECRSLTTCLEAGEVYSLALDLLLRSLSRRRGIALFRRSSVEGSYAVAFRGFNEDQARRLREILVDEKPLNFETLTHYAILEDDGIQRVLRDAGVEPTPVLVVPLRGRETESGVLWVLQGDRPFEPGEMERVRILSGHAELSLSNAEEYSRAKERAFIDDVTELYNTRYLLAAAEHELRRAERYGSEMCVIFLDLDHFKLVNDEHGHLVGSRALRQLGQVVRECVRQVDTVARYGGDEFTILLVDTKSETARVVAERIRAAVESHLFEAGRGRTMRLTVSVGVAVYPGDARTREALLDLADKAMYRAKSQGRNRVCAAGDLDV